MKQYKQIIDDIEYDVIDYENKYISHKKWFDDSKQYKYCLQINEQEINFKYTKNGLEHRDNNLPSYQQENGYVEYCYEGQLHRTNGPAIICSGDVIEYYIHGKRIYVKTDEDFFRYINLMNFE